MLHSQDSLPECILNWDQLVTDFLHELSLNKPAFFRDVNFILKGELEDQTNFQNKVM